MELSASQSNAQQLQVEYRKLRQWLILVASFGVLLLAGVAWGVRDWLNIAVQTQDCWLLPGSFLFLLLDGALLWRGFKEDKRLRQAIEAAVAKSSVAPV